MTATMTPRSPGVRAGRDNFAQLLWSEWTKFRTVRGWVAGTAAAAVTMILVGLLATSASTSGQAGTSPTLPAGPDGEPVNDSFYFVRQEMRGDGSITVPVTSLTGVVKKPGGERAAVQPWAKAGLIVKAGLGQGSAYGAVMATGGHGVRMQYDYTHDTAGVPGRPSADAPRWLRLVRTGDVITGYDSTDGARWTRVGTARLSGLPQTVQVGLFVASPAAIEPDAGPGGVTYPAMATAVFGKVGLQGGWAQRPARSPWRGGQLGRAGTSGSYTPGTQGGFSESGDTIAVRGAGDIAPVVGGPALGGGYTIEGFLVGAFAAMIVMIVIGALFITVEYRRGIILTTLAASPRRGRVLAAKAVVLGVVAFGAGLAASLVMLPLGRMRADANGFPVFPVPAMTELRVVVGTALLVAVAAVLAVALGTLLRRSAAAITIVVAAIVLPYVLAVVSVLPAGLTEWLLRATPAAGFAIQQSVPEYEQVASIYTPTYGYYPLAPWAGFAVLCGYTALALAAAAIVLRRRDA